MSTGFFCAATQGELQTCGWRDMEMLEPERLWKIPEGYAAVTGVGIPSVLLRLPMWLDRYHPHWIVQTGIAGAYADAGWKIGDIALGTSEIFADLGMEMPDGEAFRPLSQFAFADPTLLYPTPLWIPPAIAAEIPDLHIQRGRGATVNCCTGRAATGALRRRLFAADFESMEGAAVALAGVVRGLPVLEVRAISNIAADRDMQPENIAAALQALTRFWQHRRKDLA